MTYYCIRLVTVGKSRVTSNYLLRKGEKILRKVDFERRRKFVYDAKPLPIKLINRVVSSKLFVFVLAALACLAFTFSREFEFYVFVIIYGLYVGLFADDLSPLMPLFPLCYITPSNQNNPGKTSESVFYGNSGTFLLIFVLSVVTIIFVRIIADYNMGIKRLLFKKRSLSFGLILLGISYLISGILWERYSEFAARNLAFAAIQFLSVFFLYFIFSATVDWHKFKLDYIACIGLAVGLVVSYELVWVYQNCDIIVNGFIDRSKIATGWAVYNNMGAMICMAIPFAFYFAAKKIFPTPWLVIATALLGFTFLSCSRSASLVAIIIFLISYAILWFTAKNKFSARVFAVIIAVAAVVLAIKYWSDISELYARVPKIYEVISGDIEFNDSNRFELYKNGWQAFLDEPILGKTFFPTNYDVYDAATLDSFSAFFPPRWHNTVIQLLASCGIVGLGAYLIHRLSTVVLFIKKRNSANIAIGISILALLLTSLLDCHFFNVGPTLFYSIMLAVMEFGKEEL